MQVRHPITLKVSRSYATTDRALDRAVALAVEHKRDVCVGERPARNWPFLPEYRIAWTEEGIVVTKEMWYRHKPEGFMWKCEKCGLWFLAPHFPGCLCRKCMQSEAGVSQ